IELLDLQFYQENQDLPIVFLLFYLNIPKQFFQKPEVPLRKVCTTWPKNLPHKSNRFFVENTSFQVLQNLGKLLSLKRNLHCYFEDFLSLQLQKLFRSFLTPIFFRNNFEASK